MCIVLDGVISMAAALVAGAAVPRCAEYLIPSHLGKEPAAVKLARCFTAVSGDPCGNGTGRRNRSVMMFTLLDMAMSIYGQSATFSEIK